MGNRIVQYYLDSDALLARPSPVNVRFPARFWIGRDVLAAVLEDNLTSLVRRRSETPESDEEAEANDQVEAELRRFLTWVRAWPGVNVFVSLYPWMPKEHRRPTTEWPEQLPDRPEWDDIDYDSDDEPSETP